MTRRLLLISALFVICGGYLTKASRAEKVPTRQPLSELPFRIDDWQGRDTARFSDQIERVLGVDEYVSRVYARPGEPQVSLYLGYYQSQRQGDTIHSPLNCLPGAGWQPVHSGRADISVGSPPATIHVNRYVVEKGLERQLVLYWYQSHGRVIASEYWSKAFLVYDAIQRNRTDAALVRVISPILPGEGSESPAMNRATAFVQSMFPLLSSHLPS